MESPHAGRGAAARNSPSAGFADGGRRGPDSRSGGSSSGTSRGGFGSGSSSSGGRAAPHARGRARWGSTRDAADGGPVPAASPFGSSPEQQQACSPAQQALPLQHRLQPCLQR